MRRMQVITRAEVLALPISTDLSILRTGDLFVCSGTSLESRCIQRLTGSPFSHTGMVYWVNGQPPLLLEAVNKYGVRLCPLLDYLTPSDPSYDGPCLFLRHGQLEGAGIQRAIDFGLGQLTVPYSYTEIFRLALRLTFGIQRKPATHGWICSELVEAELGAAGIQLGRAGNVAVPGDVWLDPQVKFLARGV